MKNTTNSLGGAKVSIKASGASKSIEMNKAIEVSEGGKGIVKSGAIEVSKENINPKTKDNALTPFEKPSADNSSGQSAVSKTGLPPFLAPIDNKVKQGVASKTGLLLFVTPIESGESGAEQGAVSKKSPSRFNTAPENTVTAPTASESALALTPQKNIATSLDDTLPFATFFQYKKVRVETIGCRLNQIESEGLIEALGREGLQVTFGVTTDSDAIDNSIDAVVLNTCAVTQKAEQKCRRAIRLLLRHYPSARLFVTGCYAQLQKSAIEAISDRIAVTPRFSLDRFSFNASVMSEHSRALLKIQDGCNNRCSYCVICIARGRSVSLLASTVVLRAQKLEAAGYTEVTLTGVNLAQYKSGKVDLTRLLKLCLEGTERVQFRLSSIHPTVVTEEFCAVIKNPRVAPFFHLSLQSGSDKVLSLMGRVYKRADVLRAVRSLRVAKDDPFISCDIIVGHPGEGDEDFDATMELCKECDFAFIHVFPFSARPGTKSASMAGAVPQRVARLRAKTLEKLATDGKMRYAQRARGKVFFATVEKKSSGTFCVTENFLHCALLGGAASHQSGDAVKVKITAAEEEKITAVVVGE